jgi:hypothetical protein
VKLAFVLSGAPLSLLLPLGLGLCLALALLYLLREKHRPLVVPFVDLWRRASEKRRSSAPWQRLRRLLSLLLQLILLALLLAALADPRSDAAGDKGRTVVFLVDVSPSMAAVVDRQSGRTRLDEAKRRLSQWANALGQRDRALVLSLSARPQVETAWTNDRRLLERAITSLSPKHSAADLPRALRLAREVLPPGAEGEVILLGDGAYPELRQEDIAGLRLSFEPALPGPAPRATPENVGISNFSARRYPDDPRTFEAQLELSGTAPGGAEVEVLLYSIDEAFQPATTIEVKRALIPAQGRLLLPLAELSGATEGVIADVRRIDGGSDWLSADNRAQLLLAPLPPLRVLLLGPPNQFLDAALLAEPGIETSREVRTDVHYDIVIHDGAAPDHQAGRADLYLGPHTSPDFPLRLGRQLRVFGFDRWKRDSPLFSAVEPYDVQVLEGHALTPDPGDSALAFSGQDPIVVMGERDQRRFVALGFDPKQSDFYLRAAWPLFLHNTLRELAPRASGEDGIAVSPGRQWHLRTPLADPIAQVRGPLGQPSFLERRAAVTEQRTTVFGELAGFYQLDQGQRSVRFVANYFDEAEARHAPTRDLSLAATSESGKGTIGRLPSPRPFRRQHDLSPWLILLAVALFLSFSEWWTYHRRWTV